MSEIIVVDDDITMIRLVQLHLRRTKIKGHYFQNGAQCLHAATYLRPDLALLDYDLPDMKGTEIMAELRKLPGNENLPVLIFTARTSSELLPTIKGSGVSDVLTKPFSPTNLIRKIESLLPKE
ncbi:response regulator [Cerasicoccus maritimus]|uniref:response regulator n=1 Tax=Cerasicoccus maritimus TaxID=490089 RepID=UPI0028526200|nr:response regulator [Cerasicoccus maritimus]